MKLDKYRSSFLCSFVGKKETLLKRQELAQSKGYQALHYLTLESLLADVKNNPPHFVCWHLEHFNDSTFLTWVDRFQRELPETRLIVLTGNAEPDVVMSLKPKALYSCLNELEATPFRTLTELDHAAENIVYQYLNEQLSERVQELEAVSLSAYRPEDSSEHMEAPIEPMSSLLGPYLHFQKEVFEQKTVHSSIESFLTFVERSLPNEKSGAVYFKYNAPRKTLVAAYGLGVDQSLIQGIGLHLERVDPSFRRNDILGLHQRDSFKTMMNDVFSIHAFTVNYLTLDAEVIGVMATWGIESGTELSESLNSGFELLEQRCQSLDSSSRLHNVDSIDETRYALKKHKFFQKMNEEVARARRTSMPLAFVLLSVDNFKAIEERVDSLDMNLFLRSVAQIVKKHSRVNDILGRISRSEFGLLLPHTPVKGGVVKAERLRRMIESANFRKLIESSEPVTLSLAVSEYPSVCRDSDELFQCADQVLFDHDEFVANKVVVAKAPDGFIPDFQVREAADAQVLK